MDILQEAIDQHNQGNLDEAEKKYRQILQNNKTHHDAWHLLGVVHYQKGHLDKAVQMIQKALSFNPSNVVAYNNLGNVYLAKQQFKDALDVYEKALKLNQSYAPVYCNLANIYHHFKRYDEADQSYQKSLEIDGSALMTHQNFASFLCDRGRAEEALPHVQKVLQHYPQNEVAINTLGNILHLLGEPAEALKCFDKCIKIHPQKVGPYLNKGLVYASLFQFDLARSCYQEVLHLSPSNEIALNCLAAIEMTQKNYKAAQDFLRLALTKNPNYYEARVNQALAHYYLGDADLAKKEIEKLSHNYPNNLQLGYIHTMCLPTIYESETQLQSTYVQFKSKFLDAIKMLQQAAVTAPHEVERLVSLFPLFKLAYFQDQEEKDLLKPYGDFLVRLMGQLYPGWSADRCFNERPARNKIRLGFVSSFFSAHTVGRLMKGWIKDLNRDDFEVYAYHVGSTTDEFTQAYQSWTDHFKVLPSQIKTVASQINADELDVLIYTDIGMESFTRRLASLRLAPVQCKAWGHPQTTGLSTIDYYLSSDLMEDCNADSFYTEKLIRLPNLALNYDPVHVYPLEKTRQDFSLPEDRQLVLCTQSLFKYLPRYDEVLVAIAKKNPLADFVFVGLKEEEINQKFKQRLQAAFIESKLDESRIHILDRMLHSDFLNLYQLGDLYLDSIGWSGGQTSLEAMACGIPIVTCPMELMRSRHTYAFLKMAGIEEGITENLDQYVERATDLLQKPDFYQAYQNKLKEKVSTIFNDQEFVLGLEKFLKSLKSKTAS